MHIKDFSICCNYESKKSIELNRCFVTVKNNWFEGFMIEDILNNDDTNIGLVFGFYIQNKIIDMFYCCGDKIIRYCMEWEKSYWNGSFSSINTVLVNNGCCTLKDSNCNLYSENDLFNKISICKSSLNYTGKKFYDLIFENKDWFMYFSYYRNQLFPKIMDLFENRSNLLDKNNYYEKKYMLVFDDKKGYDWLV